MKTRDNVSSNSQGWEQIVRASLGWQWRDYSFCPTAGGSSINQDGKTFPEGSFWLRNERGNLKAGWTWAKGYRNSAMTVKSALKPTPIRGPKDRNASVAVFSRDLALGHDGREIKRCSMSSKPRRSAEQIAADQRAVDLRTAFESALLLDLKSDDPASRRAACKLFSDHVTQKYCLVLEESEALKQAAALAAETSVPRTSTRKQSPLS